MVTGLHLWVAIKQHWNNEGTGGRLKQVRSSRGGSREKSDQGSAKISWVWPYGCGNKYKHDLADAAQLSA